MRAHFGLICFVLLLNAGAAQAQHLAPTPKKSPTTPVKSHNLTNAGKKIPSSRLLQGKATIINTQTLSLNGFKIRLFGIVPPYLGASYGPQARAVMDSLAAANTTCKVLDRQRDGHYLARCHNDKKQDFGLELLRRGLSVTARGSIKHTDVERNYIAAEQTAQSTRLGLWSMAVPKAASSKSIQDQATRMARAKIEATAKKAQAKARAAQEAKEQEAKVQAQAEAKKPTPMISLAEGSSTSAPNNISTIEPLKTTTLTADEILAALSQPPLGQSEATAPIAAIPVAAASFWERFQLMITGLLMLGTALIVVGAMSLQRYLTRREEVRAVAAAIRGELMAARSICKARLSKIEDEQSEDDITWPRLRTLVFQAYVGRIGELGAELSRQIASIYGQASDYAAYYRSHNGKDTASKHRALEALVHHIDEINPRLAMIEQSGTLHIEPAKPTYGHLKLSAARRNNLSLPSTPAAVQKTQQHTPEPAPAEPQIEVKKIISDEMAKSLTQAKAEIEETTTKEDTTTIVETETVDQTPAPQKPKNKKSKRKSKAKKKKDAIAAAVETKSNPEQSFIIQESKADKAMAMINFAAPIFDKITQLKDKAGARLGATRKSQDEFSIPDYANLTEAEIEDLLFAEEEMLVAATDNKTKQAG